MMYIPPHFKIENEAFISEIIQQYGFATLISQHQSRPFATHLPLLFDKENGYLHGHFARPNPQWTDIEHQEVLVIFQGPHCYISPSWYESQGNVPTWNYVTVHVYGTVEFVTDTDEAMDSMKEMITKYETPTSSYTLDYVPTQYLQALIKGIQPFKIKITSIEGKAKLSQNHPEERKQLVISQLEHINQENEQKIATWMKKY